MLKYILINKPAGYVTTAKEQFDGQAKTETTKRINLFKLGIFYMLILFCFYAIVSNYVKDGLTTWVPQILNEQYNLDDSLSIILTLVLPILGLCGAVSAVFINKFVKNHSDLLGVFFALSTVTILGIQLLFETDLWYLALLLFGLVSLFMNGVNNVITNMFPLHDCRAIKRGLLRRQYFVAILNCDNRNSRGLERSYKRVFLLMFRYNRFFYAYIFSKSIVF